LLLISEAVLLLVSLRGCTPVVPETALPLVPETALPLVSETALPLNDYEFAVVVCRWQCNARFFARSTEGLRDPRCCDMLLMSGI
jgi:hypothetical protein